MTTRFRPGVSDNTIFSSHDNSYSNAESINPYMGKDEGFEEVHNNVRKMITDMKLSSENLRVIYADSYSTHSETYAKQSETYIEHLVEAYKEKHDPPKFAEGSTVTQLQYDHIISVAIRLILCAFLSVLPDTFIDYTHNASVFSSPANEHILFDGKQSARSEWNVQADQQTSKELSEATYDAKWNKYLEKLKGPPSKLTDKQMAQVEKTYNEVRKLGQYKPVAEFSSDDDGNEFFRLAWRLDGYVLEVEHYLDGELDWLLMNLEKKSYSHGEVAYSDKTLGKLGEHLKNMVS